MLLTSFVPPTVTARGSTLPGIGCRSRRRGLPGVDIKAARGGYHSCQGLISKLPGVDIKAARGEYQSCQGWISKLPGMNIKAARYEHLLNLPKLQKVNFLVPVILLSDFPENGPVWRQVIEAIALFSPYFNQKCLIH